MEVGNDIVIQNGTQWSFGNGVAQHFDEHVRQSIPLYDEGHDLVCHLSDFFIRDHSLCYELGSATGNLIGKLYQRHKSKKEVRFIGIEEIIFKKLRLEGSMINHNHTENKEILKSVGFHYVKTIMRYGELNGYICFK